MCQKPLELHQHDNRRICRPNLESMLSKNEANEITDTLKNGRAMDSPKCKMLVNVKPVIPLDAQVDGICRVYWDVTEGPRNVNFKQMC